ncbi:hypothetical protein Nepgr_009086 [Nepenthes gracilis]|uniref:ADP/ATP translocase n=1 Tax=Nepenthes gracilis TaxID=150966 RepID=A0AAD3XK33_NEPGR|nr:hypothetical protein Nepgr_009086 [Nepenthes gracilis]
MGDGSRHPSILLKMHGQSSLIFHLLPNLRARSSSSFNLCNVFVNGGLQNFVPSTYQGTGLAVASPVLVRAPAVKGNFMVDFLMGGVSAAVSKTAAAPIERV